MLNRLQRNKLNRQVDNIRKCRDAIRELPASVRLKLTEMERHLEKELDDRINELSADAREQKAKGSYLLEIRVRGETGVVVRRSAGAYQPSKTDVIDIARRVRAEGKNPLSYKIVKLETVETADL